MVRIFVTGGTFDKEYHELTGALAFKDTHLPEMLRLGRCRVDVSIRTLMMIDSLDMTDADRASIVDACGRAAESRILMTTPPPQYAIDGGGFGSRMRRRALCILHSAFCIVAIAACSRAAAPSTEPPPNVLLVTIDTFRADRLGVGVAPALDRLADAGVRFTAARSAVPLTLPSHTTILTGLLPPAHGVRENGVDMLSDAHPTLARLLKGAGYQTAAFVGAFVLDRRFGLAQGFETYDDQIPRDPNATERLEAERPASEVVDRALAWLEATHATSGTRHPAPDTAHPAPDTAHPAPDTAHPAPGTAHPAPGTAHPAPGTRHQAPFFVWIHLYDPHAPYTPPPEFRARTNTPYDGEIAYADSQIARVFEWLRAHALADRTLIVVAGDHGEGLGDHGERTHGMLLYDSTLRVPLVVAAPGRAAGRRADPVSLVDVAPTILRAAGITPPEAMTGRDLLGVVRLKADTTSANRSPASRSVRLQPDLYAETEYPRVAGWSPLQALTDGRWMAIRAGGSTELYDLNADPQEQHDVAAVQASTAAAMAARIDAIRASAPDAPAPLARERRVGVPAAPGRGAGVPGASDDAHERLRALGYVAGTAPASGSAGAPNPATKIATWNEFEEALSALNSHGADALPALAALAKAHPDAPVFQTTYAAALKDAGRVRAALAVYRDAARRWPTDGTLLHDLAVAARDAAKATSGPDSRARLNEAMRADRAAIALAPASATAHNGLGLIAVDNDRPQDGVKEFEQATALDPNNASYWANLGNAKRALHDASGAERAYRRALDVDPRAVDAANGLGVLLVDAQRPAEAVPWFERAVAAAPGFLEARLNLGIALQQSGQTTRAATVYRDVLKAPARYARERDAAAKLLAALGTKR